MTLSITSNFDAGAIEVLACEDAGNIRLRVARWLTGSVGSC